jgi:S1 RNA binding domain
VDWPIDSVEDGATWVRSFAGVARLADEIQATGRDDAIVCVTVPSWASTPLVDTAALAESLDGLARVYVVRTGELSWELTGLLPPSLDVYGGALRLWWPFGETSPDPLEHPLFFVHDRGQSDKTIARIVACFQERGLLESDRPPVGTESGAVIDYIRPGRVEMTLTGGALAYAEARQLTRARRIAPAQVVRPGQVVRVEVIRGDPGPRVPVTLLPFEPDPWDRLLADYREGMVVEGVVKELRNYGAMLELLPGVRGLLHNSQITGEWTHADEHVEVGEAIFVRIVRIERDEEKIDLSLLGIPDDFEAEPLISIYPDGPPWLPDAAEESEAVWVASSTQPVAPTPESEPAVPVEVAEPEPDVEPEADVEPEVGATVTDEAGSLEEAILSGRELQREIGTTFAGVQRRMDELRAEARQLLQTLVRDLAEARLRVLEFAEEETAELVGSTEAELVRARDEVESLRERLAAAEEDRRELLQRVKDQRERLSVVGTRAQRLGKELAVERARADQLEEEIAAAVDPDERFTGQVRRAWEASTTPSDRHRYPWREPVVGPDFLDSLERVHGVSRERVVEVCAHVVSGRAAEISGLELHQLRSSESGDASQLRRRDGAVAWRASLQVSTPAARRLHYWELPGGGVELAKIVYHDDFTIR